MDQIETFLNALFGNKPEDLHILLWTLDNKLSAWFKDCDAAASYAREHATNLYAGVGLSPANYGPRNRCKAADIAGMVALPADIDLLGDAHKSKALPTSDAHAMKLLPPQFPPSMVIQSGHGLQAWWILRQPWIFKDEEDRKRGAALAQRWDRFLKMRAARLGFTVDSVFDLSRIMRVPGTINQKPGLPPASAAIQSITAVRYDIADFERILESVAPAPVTVTDIPVVKTGPALVKPTAMPRPVDAIVYNPNAVINPAIFAALWANDMTFRLTWGGGRLDFQGDQSQSAYDLALANLMYDAGVPDQETANALVHHRRLRNQPPKPKPQYYLERTLDKARSRSGPLPALKDLAASIDAMMDGTLPADDDGLPSPAAIERLAAPLISAEPQPAPVPSPVPTEPGATPEVSADQRAASLFHFNEAINLTIDGERVNIVKAVRIPMGDSAAWRLNLANGRMIHLSHERQWSQYDLFAGEIRTQCNGVIAIPNKKADWQRRVMPLFQASLVEETTGADADYRENIRDLIDSYLASRGVWTREHAYADARTNGLPYPYKREENPGPQISIYIEDVLAWLQRTRGEKRVKQDITPGLSAIGAYAIAIRRNRRTTQGRWLLGPEWIAADYILEQKRGLMGSDAATAEEVPGWQN